MGLAVPLNYLYFQRIWKATLLQVHQNLLHRGSACFILVFNILFFVLGTLVYYTSALRLNSSVSLLWTKYFYIILLRYILCPHLVLLLTQIIITLGSLRGSPPSSNSSSAGSVSPKLLAWGELEFRKAFLILSYIGE